MLLPWLIIDKLMKKEEEIAAKAFHQWLEERGWTSEWVPVKCDPPDLHFHVVRGVVTQEWAVEVTQLFQYVDNVGKKMNARDIQALIDPLCERLKSVLPRDSKLGYWLLVASPFAPKMLKIIEQRAASYIRSGETEEECLDFTEVFEKELGNIPQAGRSPEVLEAVKSRVKPKARFFILGDSEAKGVNSHTWFHASARTPHGNALAGHIRSTLEFSVRRILNAKLPRLQKLTDYQRKLLLIVQDYDYAEPERLTEVFAELETPGADAILLIDSAFHAHLVCDPGTVFKS
jgi:hypothetical protein